MCFPRFTILVLAISLGAGLASSSCAAFQDDGATGGGGGAGATTTTSTGVGGTSGLPCDVAGVLEAHCLTCHADPPLQGAPISLNTYGDLVAASVVDAAETVAQLSVARMQDTTLPMPPRPATPVTASDVAVLQAWIAAGYPGGDCGGTTTCAATTDCPAGRLCQSATCIDPLDAAPACTSGKTSYAHEGYDMEPGAACVSCHRHSYAPVFSVAGTVYPTGHEPDTCEATPEVEQATVIIIDANGNEALHLTPNAVGNFTSLTEIALPITAKVVYQGRERVMATPQNYGDCNACHTENGDNPVDTAHPAPGRITLP